MRPKPVAEVLFVSYQSRAAGADRDETICSATAATPSGRKYHPVTIQPITASELGSAVADAIANRMAAGLRPDRATAISNLCAALRTGLIDCDAAPPAEGAP